MAHSMGVEWWRPVAAARSADAGRALAKDSAVPFTLLQVFTFIMLLSPQTFLPKLVPLRIALLTGGFAVAAHCWTRFAARRSLMRFTREIWLAAALLGWAVVTIPLSQWVGGSVQVLFDLYLKAVIIFWLLSNTVTTPRRLRAVAWGLSLMAAPLAATGVSHFLAHDELGGRIIGYEAPLTGNPNDLALMLDLILPVTISLFLLARRAAIRTLLAGLIALDVSAVIVTFSRGGFITLVVVLLLYLPTLHRRREWKWAILALMLAVMALPLLPAGYTQRLSTITNINADPQGSAQNRWRDTVTGLGYALTHPLVGAGLGMNSLVLHDVRGSTYYMNVHNVYVEYAMDLGWPGVGLFLLLLVGCIRGAACVRDRCAGRRTLQELCALAEALRITLVAFAVNGFFSPVAYNFYFYYFGGLAVALPAIHAHAVSRAGNPDAPASTEGVTGNRGGPGSPHQARVAVAKT